MRAVLGLLLVMLGVAAVVVGLPQGDAERHLAVITDIAVRPAVRQVVADRDRAPDPSPRTFSPQTPLLASVEPPAARGPIQTAGVAQVVSPVAQPPVRTSGVATGSLGASVVVAAAAGAGGAGGVARSPAQPGLSHDELVREMQRELRRVGCYAGEVDGDWGSGSRRAVAQFTERVNASLPLDQPDIILLTLIRGQTGTVCGKPCPQGQVPGASGRCQPHAVVAQAARRGSERRPSARNAGREVAAVPAPPPAPSGSGWTTRVQRLPPATTLDGAAPAAVAVLPAPVAPAGAMIAPSAVAPLPGRMAMGGPQGNPPILVQPVPPLPAAEAVRGDVAAEVPPVVIYDAGAQPAPPRARRVARRGGSQRNIRYAPGPTYVYVGPSRNVYASAPRRSRSWTATFFGMP